MFADDLADLKDRYAERFHLVHVLSRETTEVELFSGRIDSDRLRRMLPRSFRSTQLTSGSSVVRTPWLSAPRNCCSAKVSLANTSTPSCSMSATMLPSRPSNNRP